MVDSRLFIVSNRLPVNVTGTEDDVRVHTSSGGLITAINSFLQKKTMRDVFWTGVPGCSPSVWKKAEECLPPSEYTFLPVLLYKDQYEQYYNGFSNSLLWPLFHYFPSYAEYRQEHYENYLQVNEHFAEVLLRQLCPGDTVWIHDYHLLPLARMLRQAQPGLTIGFFLHIPFPSYELLRLLPRKWQETLLEGILGADLIGFHTIDYAAHFLQSVQMVLGLDQDRHIIRFNNRLIKVDVFPISIDYEVFQQAGEKPEVGATRSALQNRLSGQKIIFSIDRLDYTKGVPNRLRAYARFLQENPQYHGKVVFILVVIPSRDTIPRYAERKRLTDELISQINSSIGTLHWQPVIYRYSSLSFDDMVALYTACDLALITPLRDGMNLVAKEFVASRKNRKGVLVLSEMAGAARELTDALLINPNDEEDIAQKIREGLEMEEEEQGLRMQSMQGRIRDYDVQTWAEDFISELRSIKKRQESFHIRFLDGFDKRQLLADYGQAASRLFLLDYDGTLVPYVSNPEMAVPDQPLLRLLQDLSTCPGNEVFLISGRSRGFLEKHFGHLPINLVAEHGALVKYKEHGWRSEVQTHSEWKAQAYSIMEMFVRRCPNSFIEEKDFSIVWHYRNCNAEQGKLRAMELGSELQEYIRNRHLQVLKGAKIIEVRNSGINKGTAIKKLLDVARFDYVFAAGDDRTDEDIFKLLIGQENCYSIKVGTDASFARYNLQTPQMVVSLLQTMNHVTQNRGVSSEH